MRGVGALAGAEQVGGQAARQLDLVLDVAVVVEVPEEAVLVVGNLHSQHTSTQSSDSRFPTAAEKTRHIKHVHQCISQTLPVRSVDEFAECGAAPHSRQKIAEGLHNADVVSRPELGREGPLFRRC